MLGGVVSPLNVTCTATKSRETSRCVCWPTFVMSTWKLALENSEGLQPRPQVSLTEPRKKVASLVPRFGVVFCPTSGTVVKVEPPSNESCAHKKAPPPETASISASSRTSMPSMLEPAAILKLKSLKTWRSLPLLSQFEAELLPLSMSWAKTESSVKASLGFVSYPSPSPLPGLGTAASAVGGRNPVVSALTLREVLQTQNRRVAAMATRTNRR